MPTKLVNGGSMFHFGGSSDTTALVFLAWSGADIPAPIAQSSLTTYQNNGKQTS